MRLLHAAPAMVRVRASQVRALARVAALLPPGLAWVLVSAGAPVLVQGGAAEPGLVAEAQRLPAVVEWVLPAR